MFASLWKINYYLVKAVINNYSKPIYIKALQIPEYISKLYTNQMQLVDKLKSCQINECCRTYVSCDYQSIIINKKDVELGRTLDKPTAEYINDLITCNQKLGNILENAQYRPCCGKKYLEALEQFKSSGFARDS